MSPSCLFRETDHIVLDADCMNECLVWCRVVLVTTVGGLPSLGGRRQVSATDGGSAEYGRYRATGAVDH